MSALSQNRTDWADDGEPDLAASLPAPQITTNKDGTETIVTYLINEEGKKVKRTQRIRKTVIKRYEKPSVAERKLWPKMGLEAGRAPGPHPDTTTLGENIVFNPTQGFKAGGQQEKNPTEDRKAEALKKMQIKCRICSGDHFTTKCPFKDTMAPDGEAGAGHADMGPDVGKETLGALGASGGGGGGGGMGGSSYVPPHLRKGASAAGGGGERMGGKYERDDLATLRVTNVSEFADEGELRDLFERYGRVTRVFLAKDRETNRAKGFCFVSFADRSDAVAAQEKLDGVGYLHLILRVEFAKKTT